MNSVNLINHCSMNWDQFKDPVSHICLAGDVVASRSLTQEVAGLSPFTVMTNTFVTDFHELNENNSGKTQLSRLSRILKQERRKIGSFYPHHSYESLTSNLLNTALKVTLER